jgi:hypothetical protein
MTTGASPISAEVFDFLRICFGATVIEVGCWLHPAVEAAGHATSQPEAGPLLMQLAGGAQQRSNDTHHQTEHPKLQL